MMLPIPRQIQILADMLKTASIPSDIEPEQLSEPWRGYFQWCIAWIGEDPANADVTELNQDFLSCYGAASREDLNNYRLILQAINQPVTYESADRSLAATEEVEWLWKGWLVRGLPTLLAAAPGTGKSYLALDLAWRIIAGEPYPDGQPATAPGTVLYVDAENTPVIYKERVSVWPPALLQRLYFMQPLPDHWIINLDAAPDRDRLCDMAWMIRPTLIVIDSYGACTLKGENYKEDVQMLLAFFTQLAKDADCAVLVIHHLRKAPNMHEPRAAHMTIDAIRGSSHIAATARQVWGLEFVPSGPERKASDPRKLSVLKTNISAPPSPLGITFEPHPANPEVALISYGKAPQPYRARTRVEICAEWILAQLTSAGTAVKPDELIRRGASEGFYRMLIYRARKQLGELVVSTDARGHRLDGWALAEWSADTVGQSGPVPEAEARGECNSVT